MRRSWSTKGTRGRAREWAAERQPRQERSKALVVPFSPFQLAALERRKRRESEGK